MAPPCPRLACSCNHDDDGGLVYALPVQVGPYHRDDFVACNLPRVGGRSPFPSGHLPALKQAAQPVGNTSDLFGWSVLGVLAVCSAATLLIATQEMDRIYQQHPLELWQIVEGRESVLPDTIFLTAGLPAYLRAKLQECTNTEPEVELVPAVGTYQNEIYSAPKRIDHEMFVKFIARSRVYGDVKEVRLMLLPDAPSIQRTQYPIEDDQGRRGLVDVIVVSKDDSWVYNNEEFVERYSKTEFAAGGKHESPVCKAITALANSHAFDPYTDVIGVGTASREGPIGKENDRALRRSIAISRWVNYALRTRRLAKHVYIMNLGQYVVTDKDKQNVSTDETAPERPVIIFGVVRKGELDTARAIQKKIEHSSEPFFRMLHSHYTSKEISLFDESSSASCSGSEVFRRPPRAKFYVDKIYGTKRSRN